MQVALCLRHMHLQIDSNCLDEALWENPSDEKGLRPVGLRLLAPDNEWESRWRRLRPRVASWKAWGT